MTIILNTKNWALYLLTLLGVINFWVSFYLFKIYNLDIGGSAFCEIGSIFSCDVVNTSHYAKIFNVPVSFLGILYSLGYLWILLKVYFNSKNWLSLFFYSALGIPFVIYFVYAEFVLHAVCLLCTYVHLFLLISFVLSYTKVSKKDFSKLFKFPESRLFYETIVGVGILSILSFFYFR